MKYFICTLGKIHLGIPAEQTERIIQVNRIQNVVHETENQNIFISIPELFRQKDAAAPHGIVLKSASGINTILLAPKIDIDMEIPEEHICQLPASLEILFWYIKGGCFNGSNLILILDPEKLMERFYD